MEFVAPVSQRHDFLSNHVSEESASRLDCCRGISRAYAGGADTLPGETSIAARMMKDESGGSGPGGSMGGWQTSPEAAPPETSQLDPRAPVRKGKWTPEEEMYTTRIINDFNKGLLPLAPGTTLRSYLSEKLNCDPMRITKKFAGASCIGKRVFMPVERTPENLMETHRSRRELEEMEHKFHVRLESMRPGGGRSGPGGSSKGSVLQSSPKTRRSTAQAAGSGGGGGAASAGVPTSGGTGARRGDQGSLRSTATSTTRSSRAVSRSPSPGAHGPLSACDDSAPHPEGSPGGEEDDEGGGRRTSWVGEEEGYGHYEPMDQSHSGDSDDSYSSPRNANPAGSRGRPMSDDYEATAASTARGASVGEGTWRHRDFKNAKGDEDVRENPYVRKQVVEPGHDDVQHRLGSRKAHVRYVDGNANESCDGRTSNGDGGRGRASPLSSTQAWGSARAGHASQMGSSLGASLNAPRTLPPAALAVAGLREGGSGARSPTWPLPRVIPEGSEISDQDAGGLLLGFFRSVHEKVQTATDELEKETTRQGDHPLVASKRGFRSISSPALTQFADYAEQLPRLQAPAFKRRKSVSSFV